jgi:CheY-like chemotaxis protein
MKILYATLTFVGLNSGFALASNSTEYDVAPVSAATKITAVHNLAQKERISLLNQKVHWESTLSREKASRGQRRNKTAKIYHANNMLRALDDEIKSFEKQRKRQQLKILIVDDSQSKLMIAKRVMESLGLIVETAECVPDALEQIQRKKPDLILTDYNMPEQNGDVLATRVRKKSLEMDPTDMGPPIVLYTASDEARAIFKDKTLFDQVANQFPQSIKEAVCEVIPKAQLRRKSVTSSDSESSPRGDSVVAGNTMYSPNSSLTSIALPQLTKDAFEYDDTEHDSELL